MTRRRSRLATVLVSTVGVTAVVLALLTATSTLTPAVAFAQTGHWVVNTAEQSVVHVDSGTAQVDARAELPADAGDPLFALQGERQGFVVSRDRVAVFGRSSLTVDTTIPVGFDEVPVGIETVGGPYLVYRSAGAVVRLGVPPLSLPIGGPVERPMWTDDGTVWMHRPDNGSFCALRAGVDALECSVAAPDEPGGLTVTGELPAFVATRPDEAQVLSASFGAPVALGADVAEAGLIADRDTEGRLAVVEPDVDRMLLTDSGDVPTGRRGGAAIPVDLGPGEFSSPVASNGVIAVLDITAPRFLTFDTAGRPLASVELPPGAEPTLTRGGDGRIYADDADGATTHVVGADGSVTSVATGGTLPGAVAIAAPPERRSPVAPPPPTLRQQLATPGPGQVSPVGNTPPQPGPAVPPGPIPIKGRPQPQPIVVPPPTGVTARVQDDSIVVTWQPVSGGGQPVSYVTRANGADPQNTTATTVTYGGLAPGTPFTFRVRATVGGAEGPESAPSAPVTIVGAPAPPANLAATLTAPNTGASTWRVTWDEPALAGGELSHYAVEHGGDNQRRAYDVAVTQTEIELVNCSVTSVKIRTVTQAPGRGMQSSNVVDILVGAERDCSMTGTPIVRGAGETSVNLALEVDGIYPATADCSITFDGEVAWDGTCGPSQYNGQNLYRPGGGVVTVELEPGRTYEVRLRMGAPTPGSRESVSAPVYYTTAPEPTAPDCTTDPPPAGC